MLVKRPGFAATSLCIVNVGASQFRGKRVALPAGRATLLNRSIFYSTVSAIITALLIIVAFASAMLRMAHEYGVAILFYCSAGIVHPVAGKSRPRDASFPS